MTQAARNALARIDSVLADNAEALKSTIANLQIFSAGLAKNAGGLDGIATGLEKMTGGGAAAAPKIAYDLHAAQTFPSPKKEIKGQIAIPVSTAEVMLATQKMLFSPSHDDPDFQTFQWADSIPQLIQAKLIQSFENYDLAHAPLRPIDGVELDDQLLIDIGSFEIKTDPDLTVKIGFSVRILAENGHLVASRVFQQSRKLDKLDPLSAVAAFNAAFSTIATDLITWTTDQL
jgi:phospholipid/cholesterol/gamma-HCH transport system substrate-binding protein